MTWAPNLLIPGVAKCGTTTLHDILAAHPRIRGGKEKEVRFLMDADDALCPKVNVRDCGLEAWRTLYPDGGCGDCDYWLDASPQYQFQQTALDTVSALESPPRVILITRAPADRLYSLYQYARYHQRVVPHVQDFAQFIDELKQPAGTPIETDKMLRTAWDCTKYDRMLDEWQRIVPPQNIFPLSIEALGAQRERVLVRLAEWLEIDAMGLLDAEVEQSNPTVVTRSPTIRKAGARLAKALPDTGPIRTLKTFVRELNSGQVDRSEKASNATLLTEIDDFFEPHRVRFDQAIRAILR